MKIKQVEELVGITSKNIRFYEEQGLLTPERAENGYREYHEENIKTLKKIKKSVDFSVLQRYNITCLSEKESARECWNWQTGKTKDLVGVCSCGFKSHLPHISKRAESFEFVQVFCFFYCLNDTINVMF